MFFKFGLKKQHKRGLLAINDRGYATKKVIVTAHKDEVPDVIED